VNPFILFWHRLFPPPPPPLPLDEEPGIIGDIARLGEAAGGDAQAAEAEQKAADS
jgi:hypothetical protein